jgi:hypothetical protein
MRIRRLATPILEPMRFHFSSKPAPSPKTVSDPLRGFRIALMGMLIFLAYLTLGKPHAADPRSEPRGASRVFPDSR